MKKEKQLRLAIKCGIKNSSFSVTVLLIFQRITLLKLEIEEKITTFVI